MAGNRTGIPCPYSFPARENRTNTFPSRPLCFLTVAALLVIVSQLESNNVTTVFRPSTNNKIATSSKNRLFVPLLSDKVTDPWKRELFGRLDRIRVICGELCAIVDKASYNAMLVQRGTRIEANVDCNALMSSEDIDAGDTSVPYPLPKELLPFYTLNGMIKVVAGGKHEDVYLGGNALTPVWTEEMVEESISQAAKGTLPGTYGTHVTNEVKDMLQKQGDLMNKFVLVIGSEKPWLEAICLFLGAAGVTTLEYGVITSEHPKIKTMVPFQFRQGYQDGTLEKFDAIVTFSSLEHSGLGRYGDALNPWGDILAVSRAWCVTKPGGKMLLGLPSGKDQVYFNAHRLYGKVRWPLVTANWRNIDGFSGVSKRKKILDAHFFEKI